MAVRTRRQTSARPQQGFEPFRELQELQDRMGQLIENAWSRPGESDTPRPWVPAVDIEETDDAWLLEAELPGVDPKDVDIQLIDDELVITGEIKERERKGVLRRRTRRTGMFEFRVTLPGQAVAEGVDADLSHGVLTIRIPKPDQARQRIAVRSGS
jgi:HSP20 family protein